MYNVRTMSVAQLKHSPQWEEFFNCGMFYCVVNITTGEVIDEFLHENSAIDLCLSLSYEGEQNAAEFQGSRSKGW